MRADEFILLELEKYLASKNITDISIISQKPKQKEFGDLSVNLAMQLASRLKKAPRQIAEEIKSQINSEPKYIAKIEIAGPGFLNFYFSSENIFSGLQTILTAGKKYGISVTAEGKKAQVEFISANPTGPLTIGHGRQAVLGDTVSRLLEAIGYTVTREYYFNNAGRQMRILGQSVRLRYLELLGESHPFPEDHYQGEYIKEIAAALHKSRGDSLRSETEITVFKDAAEQAVFGDIKNTISRLGFEMDVFFNEKSLYENKAIDKTIKDLEARELVAEKDGAVWFLTTKLGQEQDRVIVKSTGEPTYRLPDIAYHRDKMNRNFDLIVDIFGADHIATYPDVLMALKALDYDIGKIKVLIHQFVTLTEGGEKVKMSTRKANFITLDELMDEVGADVTRFFFLMRHMNSHLNFDLELARKQSDENPVYYIQYAHARICSIISFGEEKNINFRGNPDLELLQTNEEQELIKYLLIFPETILKAAENFEPHRVANYLSETAAHFHKFYTECRVITEDQKLTQARLALCEAVRIVLANGCALLGINAPERM